MIKYIKNKNFIPEQFYNKKEEKKIRSQNRLALFFLAINVFLIPVSIKCIEQAEFKVIDNEVIMDDDVYNNVNTQDVKVWVENTMQDYIFEAHITRDEGEIKLNKLEDIEKITVDNKINIYDLELNSDGKYRLGVELNE